MPKLTQVLDLDQTGFTTGLKRARGQVSKFARSATAIFGGITLGALTKKTINLGSQISDLSVQLNITTDALQGLQFAAQEAGVKSEILERAIRNVNNRAVQAAQGQQSYSDALNALNIEVSKFVQLPQEQKLEAIAKAAQEAKNNGLDPVADVARLLGEEAGPRLTEVLDRLANEGFASISMAAREAGQVMSAENISTLDALSDISANLAKRLLIELAPAIVWVAKKAVELFFGIKQMGASIAGFMPVIKAFGSALVTIAKTAFSPLILSIKNAIAAFSALGDAIKDPLGASKQALADIKKNVADTIDEIIEAPGKIEKAFKDGFGALPNAIDAASDEFGRLEKEKDRVIKSLSKGFAPRTFAGVSGSSSEAQEERDRVSANIKKLEQKRSAILDDIERSNNRSGAVTSSSLASVGGGGGVFAGAARIPEKQLDELKEINKQLTDIKQSGGGNLTT